jgi:hypothetical protein
MQTWNGAGSTRCIVQGLEDKKSGRLYSIENNSLNYKISVGNWRRGPDGKNKVGLSDQYLSLIFGHLVDLPKSTKADEIKNSAAYKEMEVDRDHYRLHFESEQANIKNSPNVMRSLPAGQIDVLVLDGG